MVHFTAAAAAAVIAALAGAVSARDCEPGERICGWTLLSDEYNATKYRPLMRANLLADRWVPDDDHMNNTLFECAQEGDGLAFPPRYCGGPDQCLAKGTGGQCPDSDNACCAAV